MTKTKVMGRKTLTSVALAALQLVITFTAVAQDSRTERPAFLRAIHFSDYAYREPQGSDKWQAYGTKYEASWETRTTIVAMNPSAGAAKVRLQALLHNGDLAFEVDKKLAPGHTAQLLPVALDKDLIPKPEWFIVSSTVPVMVDGHTIEQHSYHSDYIYNVDEAFAQATDAKRSSQTVLLVRKVNCDKPAGYVWLCTLPTRYSDWQTWVP